MTTQAGSLADVVSGAVAAHRAEPGPLLAILHDVQRELGYLPREATTLLAEQLNLSRADVHGVVTFYKDFRDTPPARRTVRICRAEACQAQGARGLVSHAERRLGVSVGEATPDGSVELRQVFCFGNCALGPTVEVDGRLHGRVDPARFDELVADAVPGP